MRPPKAACPEGRGILRALGAVDAAGRSVFGLALLFLFGGCGGPPVAPDRTAGPVGRRARPPVAEANRLETVAGVRVLHLEGDGEARGRAAGTLLGAEIRRLVARYVRRLVIPAFGGRAAALAVARAAEPHIPADLRAELRATARAARVPYEELLVLNAHVDALASGCTSVAVNTPAAAAGRLLGRNLDWTAPPDLENLAVLVVRRSPGRLPVANYTYPGFLGVLTAVSSAGVAVSMNVSPSRDRQRACLPTPLLLLDAIGRARSAADMLDRVAAGKRCSGFLITAVDAAGGAGVLEMTARHTGRRAPTQGLLAVTNHFLVPALRPLQTRQDAGSKLRLLSIRRDLAASVPLHPERLATLLHRPPVFNRATLMTVVVDLGQRRLLLWQRGMARRVFRRVRFGPWLRER